MLKSVERLKHRALTIQATQEDQTRKRHLIETFREVKGIHVREREVTQKFRFMTERQVEVCLGERYLKKQMGIAAIKIQDYYRMTRIRNRF